MSVVGQRPPEEPVRIFDLIKGAEEYAREIGLHQTVAIRIITEVVFGLQSVLRFKSHELEDLIENAERVAFRIGGDKEAIEGSPEEADQVMEGVRSLLREDILGSLSVSHQPVEA